MVKVSEYIDKEAFISEKRKQFCENCSRRKGIKHGKECFIYEIGCSLCRACDIGDMIDAVEDFPAADVVPNNTVIAKDNFTISICTASGKGFIAGERYAIIGGNNGAHVFREDKNGNPVELLLHNNGESDYDKNGKQIGGIEWLSPANGDIIPVFDYIVWGSMDKTEEQDEPEYDRDGRPVIEL